MYMSQNFSENNNMPKSCQDIALYSDKLQYNEASFLEKIKLKIHILYCEHCRKYNHKNSLLTQLIQKKEYETLKMKDLNEIKEKLISAK